MTGDTKHTESGAVPTAGHGPVDRLVRPGAEASTLVERLRTDVLWHRRRGNETIARDCEEAAQAIEAASAQLSRYWGSRKQERASIDAAVAAERERWATAARLVVEATPEQLPLALDALRDVLGA